MNLDRVFELLSAEADDDLAKAERAELDMLISSSAEAQRLANEVRQMNIYLANQGTMEPPDGLRDDIMQRIPLDGARPHVSCETESSGRLRGFGVQSFLKYAASTAFGALLVVAVYESQPDFGPAADITQLVGTMAPGTVIADKVLLDRFTFDDAGVSSIATLERRGKAVVLDVSIEANRMVDLTIDFAATSLQFEAVAQTDTEFDSMQFTNRMLSVRGDGARRFSVLLRNTGGKTRSGSEAIRLRYESNGMLVGAGDLKPGSR